MVMVSHAPSSGERQANGRAGAQGRGNGRVERAHGTPRKEGAVKEKAVQDPGLKDYVSFGGHKARASMGIV
jgi:hypothetical protein